MTTALVQDLEHQEELDRRAKVLAKRRVSRYQPNKRIARSNYGIWRKMRAGWSERVERFSRRLKRRKLANVIPVNLRHWVPKNHYPSQARARELLAGLEEVCTTRQYKRLVKRYWLLECIALGTVAS